MRIPPRVVFAQRMARRIVAGLDPRAPPLPPLDALGAYCFFIGYPRSGHTLLGSLLNAHPDTVISHELSAHLFIWARLPRRLVFRMILSQERRFGELDRRWTGYDYAVRDQWQGRVRQLRVIGDKMGNGATRLMTMYPGLLERTRRFAGVPIRAIHHVRNPFDNIATMARRDRRSIAEAIPVYFGLAEENAALARRFTPEEHFESHHEALIAKPHEVLGRMADFLGLDRDEAWLEACAERVFAAPNRTRDGAGWTPALVDEVERRMADIPFLRHYRFDA